MFKLKMFNNDSNEIKSENAQKLSKTRKRCFREILRNKSLIPHKKTKIENTNYIKQCSKKFNSMRTKWKEIRNLNNNRSLYNQHTSSKSSTTIFSTKLNFTSISSKKPPTCEREFLDVLNEFNFANSNNQSKELCRFLTNKILKPQALPPRNKESNEAVKPFSIFDQSKFAKKFENSLKKKDYSKNLRSNRETVICNAKLDTEKENYPKKKKSIPPPKTKMFTEKVQKSIKKKNENAENCCSHNEDCCNCDSMACSDARGESFCCHCNFLYNESQCESLCYCNSPCKSSCLCSCSCSSPFSSPCSSPCFCPCPCPCSYSCPSPNSCSGPCPCPFHPSCFGPFYGSGCSEGSCVCFCPNECGCSTGCTSDFNCDPKKLEKLKECVDSLISKNPKNVKESASKIEKTNSDKEYNIKTNKDKTNSDKPKIDKPKTDRKKLGKKNDKNRINLSSIGSTTSLPKTNNSDRKKLGSSRKYKSNHFKSNSSKKKAQKPKSDFKVLTLLEKIQNSSQIPFDEKKYLLDVLNLDEESKILLKERMLNFGEILKMVTDTKEKVMNEIIEKPVLNNRKTKKCALEKMKLKEILRDKRVPRKKFRSPFEENNKENTNLSSHINLKNFIKKVGFCSPISFEDKRDKLKKQKKLSKLILSEESSSLSSNLSLDTTSNSSDSTESDSDFSKVSSNGNNKNNAYKLKKKMEKLFKSNAKLSQQVKKSIENNKNLLKQNLELINTEGPSFLNKPYENLKTSNTYIKKYQAPTQEVISQSCYFEKSTNDSKNISIGNNEHFQNSQNELKSRSTLLQKQENVSRENFTKSRSFSSGAKNYEEKPVQINYIILTNPKECQKLLKKSLSMSGLESAKNILTSSQTDSKDMHVFNCPSNIHSILNSSLLSQTKSFKSPENKLIKYLNNFKNRKTKKPKNEVRSLFPINCYRNDSEKFILEETSSLVSEMLMSSHRCRKPITTVYSSENSSLQTSEISSESYSFKDSECSRNTCSLKVYPKTKILSCRYQLPKRIKKQKFQPRITYNYDKIDMQKKLLDNKKKTLRTLKKDIKSKLVQIFGVISSPHENNHSRNISRKLTPKYKMKRNSLRKLNLKTLRNLETETSLYSDEDSKILVEISSEHKGKKKKYNRSWNSGSRKRCRQVSYNDEEDERDLYKIENRRKKFDDGEKEIIKNIIRKILFSVNQRKNLNKISVDNRRNSPSRLLNAQFGNGKNYNNCKKKFSETDRTSIRNFLPIHNLKTTIRPALSQSVSTLGGSKIVRYLKNGKLETARPQLSEEPYSVYENDFEETESEYTEVLSEIYICSQKSLNNSIYKPNLVTKNDFKEKCFPPHHSVSYARPKRPSSILKKGGMRKNLPKVSVKCCKNFESIRRT